MYCKMRYRIRLLYGNIYSGSAHPPCDSLWVFLRQGQCLRPPHRHAAVHRAPRPVAVNASVLHLVMPQFIAHHAPPRSMPLSFTSSRRSSYAGLSQKAFPSRSCHYGFRRLAVNRPHAIRFFRRLASRQPRDINFDEARQRILEQISGF